MNKKLPKRTLVLGGANSGKSAYAERLVIATGAPRHYIATAQAFDAEMTAKIAAHLAQRGPDWTTHDCPLDASEPLSAAARDDIVLFDSITLWMSNHLIAENDPEGEVTALIGHLEACSCPVVVVSDEVGLGLVPETPLGRAYRAALGRANQRLAAWADTAVFVAAGLPLALKGDLP
ncbi:MAG: bifunctional adenosylcobinamide kinase/adenosylcobinamide-phosphate guanylyltransferase [Shimia sp.]